MNLYQTLKHYFGYDTLRTGQQELMEGILKGKDVLGIMPTEPESHSVIRCRHNAFRYHDRDLAIDLPDVRSGQSTESGRSTCSIYQQFADGESDPGSTFVCSAGKV